MVCSSVGIRLGSDDFRVGNSADLEASIAPSTVLGWEIPSDVPSVDYV